jgi:homoserine kinase
MKNAVTAFAPASVSNVACGFDIMGFALEQPGDRVTVRATETPGVRITAVHPDGNTIPRDPARNTAGAPVLAMMRDYGGDQGVEIEISKGLPAGGGIGSSAASAVAAAVACNELLGAGLSNDELLKYAIEGERIASGAVHVDNLAPCLWGGFVLVRGYDPIDLVHLRVPAGLWCTVVCPDIEIRTLDARRMLPAAISLKDVITQTGNAAGLVAGLLGSDYGLISRCLHDVVAEPVRARLIPGFALLQASAIRAGALGCSISGSGPSLFALSTSRDAAGEIGRAMEGVLDDLELAYKTYVSPVARSGARLVD